jgi:hypothetical protein
MGNHRRLNINGVNLTAITYPLRHLQRKQPCATAQIGDTHATKDAKTPQQFARIAIAQPQWMLQQSCLLMWHGSRLHPHTGAQGHL